MIVAQSNDQLPQVSVESEQLVLDLEGFEGPIDLLVTLSKEQKVDLKKISILQLADQYLAYIEAAHRLHFELASDYLVMAAWLAYLKSRLLLPVRKEEEAEPDPEMLTEKLAFQIRRLESMRRAAEQLFKRCLLGREVFCRGTPEGIVHIQHKFYRPLLQDLVRSYADSQRKRQASHMAIEASELFGVDVALSWLSDIVGERLNWTTLRSFLPKYLVDGLIARSALASAFAASLELVRQGKIEIQQAHVFGPIYVRSRKVDGPK